MSRKRWSVVAAAATVLLLTAMSAAAQVGGMLTPLPDEVERFSREYQAKGYLLTEEFYHSLVWRDASGQLIAPGDDEYTVTFHTKPDRDYVFLLTASDGAEALMISYDDSLGDHAVADTRNTDAFLRPPALRYPSNEVPTTVRITGRLVRGTQAYAVPAAILVFSKLR